MPRTSLKLGPGVFTLGEGPLAVEQQLLALRITWTENVATDGEDRNFIDGTSDKADEVTTYSAAVTGTAQQDDLAADGFIAYTWEHKGEEVPFSFTPNDTTTRKVTGECKVVPLDIGGDAKSKNTSDFTFRCPTTDPVLEAVGP